MITPHDDLGPDPTSQALIRLVPTLGPVVASWRHETFERKKKRAERLGAAAAESIGPEQFFHQIASDERLSDMFNAAVDNAVATSSDAKIRLLGRALAAGVVAADEAAVDEAEQLLRVALQLDPVDLRALRALERWTGVDAERVVAHALGIDEAIAGLIVSRLRTLHLVKVDASGSINDKSNPDDDWVVIEESWSVTAAAHALMDLLHQHIELETPEATRPEGAAWSGYTHAQAAALEQLAAALTEKNGYGWRAATQRTEAIAAAVRRLTVLGVDVLAARDAMRSIGFGSRTLQVLDAGA